MENVEDIFYLRESATSQSLERAQIFSFLEDGRVQIKCRDGKLCQAFSLVEFKVQDIGRTVVITPFEDTWLIVGAIAARHGGASGKDAAQSLILKSQKDLRLECGDATLHLSRDGHVSIKGVTMDIESGHNMKIKGKRISLN